MSDQDQSAQEATPPAKFVPDVTFENIDLDHFALLKTRADKDTRHTLFTTKDKSAAYYIARGKVSKKTTKAAHEFIKEAGITLDAIHDADLASYLIAGGKRGDKGGGILIAEGSAPINGEDGYIEWHVVEPESFGVGKESAGGAVDYRERQTFSKVTKGEAILTWHPQTQGTNGRDIFGKTIEAVPGQPNKPRAGVNISTDGEGKKMSAGIDGVVKLEDDAVHVRLMLEVTDVDFSSGNIRFDGDVQVNGDVKEGFEVVSLGAVQILKSVTKASVSSRTLFVEGSAVGATLDALEHAEANLLEGSTLRVGSGLTLKGDAVNSDIHVGGPLKAEDTRVSGGTINALGEITLKSITSGETQIFSAPRHISLPELDEVDQARHALIEAMEKISAALNQDSEDGEAPKLTLQQKAALNNLRKKHDELEKQLAEKDKERRIHLMRRMKEMPRGIKILDGIASGTRFNIDGYPWEAEEEMLGPWKIALNESGDQVVVESAAE